MKLIVIVFLLGLQPLAAIPNQIIGGVNQANSPLNGQELAGRLLQPDLWQGKSRLPGNWKEENRIAETKTSHLLAKPKVFGLDAILLRATHRGDDLESVTVIFADAGSYFPYLQRKPGVPIEKQRQDLLEKQRAFQELYSTAFEKLNEELEKRAGRKAKESRWGSSRTLRADLLVYEIGKIQAVLFAENGRLLRLTLTRDRDLYRKGWLDQKRIKMSGSELSRHYSDQVKISQNGDHVIEGVKPVPQGYRPYCGLNSLTMVAQYYGLHLDEDWMAVAGKFQNTGSAAGSNMLTLYNATAREARLSMNRETKFQFSKARALIKSGLPVVVWRRFDFQRNQMHIKLAQKFAEDPNALLPEPDTADRATWPGDEHPVHASVIVGFNDKRKEVLFIESWAGQSVPRRMRYEELEATATMVFYFEGK
ncbi:hypothetical protein NT6N_01770 [Oceaniferula spumae]|uniref:Peptidase C39-like domain-containing protein n=1 Tax=Oceaniferula spumae TaxID=2979115 RepID=A0AAT9FGP1_9BACT